MASSMTALKVSFEFTVSGFASAAPVRLNADVNFDLAKDMIVVEFVTLENPAKPTETTPSVIVF